MLAFRQSGVCLDGGVHRELCAQRCVRGMSTLVGVFTGEWTVFRSGRFASMGCFAGMGCSPEVAICGMDYFAGMGCSAEIGSFAEWAVRLNGLFRRNGHICKNVFIMPKIYAFCIEKSSKQVKFWAYRNK